MRLDDMLDAEPVLARLLEIKFDVTLRIDNRCYAFGPDHVRGMSQATQIELFEIHDRQYRGHVSPRQVFTIVRNRLG